MAWGVEECYAASVLELHVVCADVLCDAACLACYDVRVADIVEQRGLAMVNVSHDSDDWGAELKVCLVVDLLGYSVLYLGRYILGREAELLCHHVDCLCVETLVDRHHDTYGHKRADELGDRDIHHGGKL